jgi:hypothetical protein
MLNDEAKGPPALIVVESSSLTPYSQILAKGGRV